MKADYSLYFITDSKLTKKGTVNDAIEASYCGAGIVQYREKEKGKNEMIAEAKKIKEKIHGKTIFIINDFIDVAKESDADGVHLGQEDGSIEKARELLGKEKIIGITAHNLREAIEAEKEGANYLGISPVFSTSTKSDAGKPCGVKLIREIKKKVKIPLIGIGGINELNAGKVIQAGADGIAAISAIYNAENFCKKIKELKKIVKEAKKKRN